MRLADIKDADGKEGLVIDKTPSDYSPSYQAGFRRYIEEQSQRQVAVEVDREKIIDVLISKYKEKFVVNLTDITREDFKIYADTLIAHKEELFTIIYVKD